MIVTLVDKPALKTYGASMHWSFAGGGMNTTQFYGIDKKPGADEYIGGTQDNGTWRSPSGPGFRLVRT